MYCRLIDGFIIKVFWKDSNLDYKRGKSEAYSIGILNFIWGVIFGMKKIKLKLVMIFESYKKGFIDCHAIIGIQPTSILKPILENYEYKLIWLRRWMISYFEMGVLILIRLRC